MGPCEVPVGGELRLLVTGNQFHTAGLVLTGVTVFQNRGHDEVVGVVVEPVDLEIQTLYPVVATKGELEGVGALRREADGLFLTYERCHDIGLTVDVGSIDKGLGIAQSDVPLGALQDEGHAWRQLTHLAVIVAVFIVETHARIQDKRAPLVLQLEIDIGPVLAAFSCFTNPRVLGE